MQTRIMQEIKRLIVFGLGATVCNSKGRGQGTLWESVSHAWEEWESVIGREALLLRGVRRKALQIATD